MGDKVFVNTEGGVSNTSADESVTVLLAPQESQDVLQARIEIWPPNKMSMDVLRQIVNDVLHCNNGCTRGA